jgi:hypothetical protein
VHAGPVLGAAEAGLMNSVRRSCMAGIAMEPQNPNTNSMMA